MRKAFLWENTSLWNMALIILLACILLYVSSIPGFAIVKVIAKIFQIDSRVFWLTSSTVLHLLFFGLMMWLYFRKILKADFTTLRISKPEVRLAWIGLSIMFPLLVLSLYYGISGRPLTYNGQKTITVHILMAIRAGLIAGITEEIVFRGLILSLFEHKWNQRIAVFVPSVFFALLHFSKEMNAMDYLQVVIAGTLAGILFSLITISSGSIWNAICFHGLWNALVLRVIPVQTHEYIHGMFTIEYSSTNRWMTGGAFGIEAGLPAILGYSLLILVIIFFNSRKDHVKKTSQNLFF